MFNRKMYEREYYKKDNGLYRKYKGIKRRCNYLNINNRDYKNYCGRGIKCLWKCYQDFKNDMYESYLKSLKKYGVKNTTIDRINVNGNYCKENCKWATWKEQSLNRRERSTKLKIEYNGKIQSIKELAKELKIPERRIYWRIKNELSITLKITKAKKERNMLILSNPYIPCEKKLAKEEKLAKSNNGAPRRN